MTVNGTKNVELVPETLYYEPAGRTFQIKNTGDGPLQVLITLIRVESPSDPLQSSLSAAGKEAFSARDTTPGS